MLQGFKRRAAIGCGLSLFFLQSSCAALYKVQLSDVDADSGHSRPLSVKVSETTVDLREVAGVAKNLGKATAAKGLGRAGSALDTYLMFFQWGPRTGTVVYNEFYALGVPESLAELCKDGYLSNITSVREAKDYPIVKGEIVRVDASCIQP
jgi:hypothetical protein